MKLISLFSLIVTLTAFSCNKPQTTTGYFGEEFVIASPIEPGQISVYLGSDNEKQAQVKGIIEKVCKASQCWLSMTDKEGRRYYFNVKEEAFKLPKNCEGKIAVVNGKLLSVSAQQEKAREKGLKESYIESISNISMEATGFFIE